MTWTSGIEDFKDQLCSVGFHQWKRVPTAMIDPSPWRLECRNCEAMPSVKKMNPIAAVRTLLLRRSVLKTYLNPKNPRFAARSEGGSAEAGFRERIARYSDETLRALLAARSDPSFSYSYRTSPLPETVLRDICAVPDMLGTSKVMSYSKSISEAMLVVHALDLGYVPGTLLHENKESIELVRTILRLLGSVTNLPSTIQPSIATLLRDEPGSWLEVSDFANAHGTGLENIHADQIMEYRKLNTSAFQGGIL